MDATCTSLEDITPIHWSGDFWILSVSNEAQRRSSLQCRLPGCCSHFIHRLVYITGNGVWKKMQCEVSGYGTITLVLGVKPSPPQQRIALYLKSIALHACASNCFHLSNCFCLSTWPRHTMKLWNQNFTPWTKLFWIQLVLRLSRCYSNWIFNGSDTFKSRLMQIQKVQVN